MKPLLLISVLSLGIFWIQNAQTNGSRSFYLGFTYQPYDWSEEAFKETFRLSAEYGDITAITFDGAVPWDEALENKPYHKHQEGNIQRKINGIESHQKILSRRPHQRRC